jgi:predicted enzyme related to lactoylglutathione lyase
MFKNNKAFSSFSVNDIDKAKEFYGETLGIEISDSMGGMNLNFSGGNQIFVYPKGDQHVPATFTVLNFLVTNIEETVDKLTSLGVKLEIYNQGQLKTNSKGISVSEEGPKMAWFKDPAGNFLSVIQEK